MRIFKFGGASVKDAAGVRNVLRVLQTVGHQDTLLVISAMGKTTNALEVVINNYFKQPEALQEAIQEVVKYHNQIAMDLFEDDQHPVFKEIRLLIAEMKTFLERNKSPKHPFVYDQIIGYGELLSTKIVSAFLNAQGLQNEWCDVRNCIKTDNNYRDANVDWTLTQQNIQSKVESRKLYITQGFLGSDPNSFTTSLGREGSDYTAAIFAYCLNAESVTIWKDVPGVLNADPRYFENATQLYHISYQEAIELAFYGASVIHPKTLQPLQRKEIPLYVKSFLNPEAPGTSVKKGQPLEPHIPCFIVKKNQVLISLSSLDFSFIVEENISEIFNLLSQAKMKVDVIQNSAISFSVCVDNKFNHLQETLNKLKAKFKVICHENVSLYTIRHYNDQTVKSLDNGKKILLKQLTAETMQMVVEG